MEDLGQDTAPSIKWVTGELLVTLDPFALDPRKLLESPGGHAPFDRPGWFAMVAEHWASQHHEACRPLVARAWGGGLHCWLFLARQKAGTAIGMANWYSMAFRPIFHGGIDEEKRLALLTAVARRLARVRPGISKITLAPVPTSDGSGALVQRAFARAGWSVAAAQTSTSWTANVSGLDFETYLAARPGQVRSTLKRKGAKADFRTRVVAHFDADDWAQYEEIYAESWKPDEGAPAFLRAFAEAQAAAGHLRLGLCEVDGVTIAAQLWTVENATAYIHKLAHRASAQALSPGSILTAAMFAHVIDKDHVRSIDFGTGNDAYKAEWMDTATPLLTIELFNPRTVRGLAAMAKARLSGLVGRRQSA